ncbi:hypothetical protein AV521_27975 [Streptomyces sp. IMTB 2501]|uniref:hypothetical protein n=1 Tax=Streptomyces sp. IMTB 2501 TaxID=1776340 RepID=UPI00096C922E|nr:hypothetical protein [Streptomyces sp. IMTB 2501]OLZ66351.1 hypothetical protein AV521_27975 [Streptomyces sp. IMTB 2501]
MRKPRKTAVVAVLLGTVGFLGAGTAYAHGQGHGHKRGHEQHGRESNSVVIGQSTSCTTAEENVDVQGESGVENGWEGKRPNGEGSPGPQTTNIGSSQGCNNTVVFGK